MLEVGCGFGFGLDVARRVLGWEVEGFDSSPFAAAGRDALALPITLDYFRPEAVSPASYDVVLLSEVLEHLDNPRSFLCRIRGVLRPGGMLTLTTPNVGAVRPDTPQGVLVPLLSVGFHTVLQSRESLERLLLDAGFVTVMVEDRGPSLLAQASTGGRAWHATGAAEHARYRRWLEDAAEAAPPASDLRLGLLGRAYREAVAAADLAAADRLLPNLDEICRTRFSISLLTPVPLPPLPGDLDGLAARIPLGIGGLLLHRGYHRLLAGEPRGPLESIFHDAAGAAAALRAALAHIGVDDADAEDVEWTASAEAAICAAAAGAMDMPARLQALGKAPAVGGGGERAASVRRRCYVALVNAGHYAAANHSRTSFHQPFPKMEGAPEAVCDDEMDVVFAAAMLEANGRNGDPALSIHYLRILRRAAERVLPSRPGRSPAVLLWPGVEAELLLLRRLGRMDEARVLRSSGVRALARLANVPPLPVSLTLADQ